MYLPIFFSALSPIKRFAQGKRAGKIQLCGDFPWVTKEMEIFPNETVLTYTSPNGIVYNKELIPKDKAPKNYADLIDPKLSPTWAGKIAIPPYVAWLAELSLVWGQDKVKDYSASWSRSAAGVCATAKRNESSAANFRSWQISAMR